MLKVLLAAKGSIQLKLRVMAASSLTRLLRQFKVGKTILVLNRVDPIQGENKSTLASTCIPGFISINRDIVNDGPLEAGISRMNDMNTST